MGPLLGAGVLNIRGASRCGGNVTSRPFALPSNLSALRLGLPATLGAILYRDHACRGDACCAALDAALSDDCCKLASGQGVSHQMAAMSASCFTISSASRLGIVRPPTCSADVLMSRRRMGRGVIAWRQGCSCQAGRALRCSGMGRHGNRSIQPTVDPRQRTPWGFPCVGSGDL